MSNGRSTQRRPRWLGMCRALVAALAVTFGAACGSATPPPGASGIVQVAELDAARPLFVPTHPRVATTIRFPGPIGAPEGRGFTEDEQRSSGEYLIAWSQGDSHLTLTPFEGAGPSNLNVPYQGTTYVLYFYPAASQFQAVASLSLAAPPGGGRPSGHSHPELGTGAVHRGLPAQWLGLVDRLKLLRAAAPGSSMERIATAFGLECRDLEPTSESWPGVRGLFRTKVLRVVRDVEAKCLGFAVRIENTSGGELTFDVASFSARAGGIRLPQLLSDAPATLARGGTTEAFFVAAYPADHPPTTDNHWLVSVALSGPRINPVAAVIADFEGGDGLAAEEAR